MKRNYYETLGIAKDASAEDVKKAYRKQAMFYHPDRSPDDKKVEYEEKFKEASEAYSVLSDEEKRRQYDAPQTQTHGFYSGTESIWRTRTVQKGAQINIGLPVTLEEAFDAPIKVIKYEREVGCSACKSSGLASGKTSVSCAQCKGAGTIEHNTYGFRVQQPCFSCNGQGKTIRPQDRCSECLGKGHTKKETTLNVKVPHGVFNGQVVSYEQMGNASLNGGPDGDAFVFFKVIPHPTFERINADDLMTEAKVGFVQLALGDKIDVKSLKGSLDVVVPPSTKNGAVLRVTGQGFKNGRTQNTGSLYVKLVGQTPTNLTERQIELLNEFAKIERTKREGT